MGLEATTFCMASGSCDSGRRQLASLAVERFASVCRRFRGIWAQDDRFVPKRLRDVQTSLCLCRHRLRPGGAYVDR
jgi:hypothetical protein